MKFLLLGIFLLSLVFPSLRGEALLQSNQILLVDDYDDRDLTTHLEGESRGDADCRIEFTPEEEAFGRAGASLSLEFNLSEPPFSSYFLVKLGADLTEMRYLSFWMKSEPPAGVSGPELWVEVRSQGQSERLAVKRFVVKKSEEGWQKAVIPLSEFRRIRAWGQVQEILFIAESKRPAGKTKVLLDHLLFGSNYPEGPRLKQILMQNRVSSFKIGGILADTPMKLGSRKPSVVLTLTFIDPYLEEIRFEESWDGGKSWRQIQSFYDHLNGGTYQTEWTISPESGLEREVLLRASGTDFLGGETQLAGPYRLNFN